MLDTQDIQVLAALGNAIWVDPETSENQLLNTLSAALMCRLAPDQTIEKACQAILEKAKSHGQLSAWIRTPELLHRPFYRLSFEERFLLTAVHLGHWPYDRLARILGKSTDVIQETLWQARLAMNEGSLYPAGPSSPAVDCPEYHPRRPWTQRFLDEGEIRSSDHFYLVQHMVKCSSCAGALARCRVLYFKVNQELHRELGRLRGNLEFESTLKALLDESPFHRSASTVNFRRSLKIFLRNPDVRYIFFLFLGLVLFLILRLAAFTTSV